MEEEPSFEITQLAPSLREKIPGMPDRTRLLRRRYKRGERIDYSIDKGGPPAIYLVESGVAEIYQESSYHCYHAYRPIKIFGPGDAIGLFTVADALTDRMGPSRPKESWIVRAGLVSTLYLDCISQDYCEQHAPAHHDDDGLPISVFKPHHLLRENGGSDETVLLKIELPSIESLRIGHDALVEWLLRNSWIDVLDYRLGKNIYNSAFYQNCRHLIQKHNDYRSIKAHGRFTKFKYKVLEPFIDAVVDALDRPTYGAPLFGACGLTQRETSSDESGKESHVDLGNMYSATRVSPESVDTLYYPVGLLNYEINRHFAGLVENERDIRTALAPSRRERKGVGASTIIGNLFPLIKEVYFTLHSQEFEQAYPYNVSLSTDLVADWNFAGGAAPDCAVLLKFDHI